MRRSRSLVLRFAGALALGALIAPPVAVAADYEHTRYMSPDELQPGMKGFGRTVMRGTLIETFDIEVIGVMRNAYYARQDVILVRCSGLNLKHSGIIGGMSGSPCYIRDEAGRERMIGAVAYGWTFNKDPVCGVQPITQMLPIPDVRTPRPTTTSAPATRAATGRGASIGEILAASWGQPAEKASRFSIFNDEIERLRPVVAQEQATRDQLRPLTMPVMISGASEHTLGRLRDRFERLGLTPVVSGGPSPATTRAAADVRLEPGSVLCIPFMRGDMLMEGLGTCTEVIGDKVLGFGHSMFGEGRVELPLATGTVHTVISSVMRSNKMGAALESVGTLVGDENSGIFGIRGPSPRMVPVDVVVNDVRGRRAYHYEVVQEENFTPALISSAALESIFAHSDPPKEQTIRYTVETEFENLGTFRSRDVTSQVGVVGIATDTALPTSVLMSSPFGKAKVARSRVEVTIEEGANLATLDQVRTPKTVYKPGEAVAVQVRWCHYRRTPAYTQGEYTVRLPPDLPDGEYTLAVGSVNSYLSGLRARRPHLFRAESQAEILEGLNLLAGNPGNRVYITLDLPTGGVAVDRMEMPQLPSFRRQILASTRRNDLYRFSDALAEQHETNFAVSGSHTMKITVSRRADQ